MHATACRGARAKGGATASWPCLCPVPGGGGSYPPRTTSTRRVGEAGARRPPARQESSQRGACHGSGRRRRCLQDEAEWYDRAKKRRQGGAPWRTTLHRRGRGKGPGGWDWARGVAGEVSGPGRQSHRRGKEESGSTQKPHSTDERHEGGGTQPQKGTQCHPPAPGREGGRPPPRCRLPDGVCRVRAHPTPSSPWGRPRAGESRSGHSTIPAGLHPWCMGRVAEALGPGVAVRHSRFSYGGTDGACPRRPRQIHQEGSHPHALAGRSIHGDWVGQSTQGPRSRGRPGPGRGWRPGPPGCPPAAGKESPQGSRVTERQNSGGRDRSR